MPPFVDKLPIVIAEQPRELWEVLAEGHSVLLEALFIPGLDVFREVPKGRELLDPGSVEQPHAIVHEVAAQERTQRKYPRPIHRLACTALQDEYLNLLIPCLPSGMRGAGKGV